MTSTTFLIAQSDPSIAAALIKDLQSHCYQIAVAKSGLELRTMLLHNKAQVAVLDLESVNVEEVRQLIRAFHNLTIVCTHRAPDETMWVTALNAGAVECCHPRDIRSILRALQSAAKHDPPIAA